MLSRKYQQWKEQADKDDADAADDESDSDIDNDDGMVAAWLQTAVCFVFGVAKLNLEGNLGVVVFFANKWMQVCM